jgi:dipeptidyl aminopeptidase/acylaminoacyl peptidase
VLWKETDLLQNLSLSPSGDQIVADIGLSSGQLGDLWIYNLPKHNSTRLTFDQHSSGPVWSPDGKQIAFSRQTETGSQIVIKNISGGGDERVVINEIQRTLPLSWTSDGRYLLYRLGLTVNGEIKVLALQGEHKAVKLLDIKSTGAGAALSPDSKWLAYVSAEAGPRRTSMSYRSTPRPTPSASVKPNGRSPTEAALDLSGAVIARRCTFPPTSSLASLRFR